ncbi:MAG: Farnesyl diphosphate synthase [Elusimicrobia bacterium]|nr:Farnesyl diphosphate synthase [Elusimicrobiota bacterium]
MPPSLKKYFDKKTKIINRALVRYLPSKKKKPSIIHQAMHYSLQAGGKRLRPVLVIAGAEVCGGSTQQVLSAACALEFVHTYSLIHDDLPAMDNDDLRRGKPTNHKVFGENIAILAGDALLTQAFELVAPYPHAVKMLAQAAGTAGMVGGQVADIQSDKGRWKRKNNEFSSPRELLNFIHLNKTAALIRASLLIGAIIAKGTENEIKALDSYGKHLGLAFQITDDVLDKIGDKKKLGKKGSDSANEKLTYPAIFGLNRSIQMARQQIIMAHQSIRLFGSRGKILHLLADFIQSRDH